jgi:hypothetical protein
MDDKKEHIIYSKADIDNYIQGKMSKEAMHSIERAALQDPFLADAIEGFALVDTAIASKDLSDIETMILAGKQPAKVVEITKKKNEWLKIAVVVLLFAGAGWIGVLLMNNSNQKSIVKNEKVNTTEDKNIKIGFDSVASKGTIANVEQKSTSQQFKSLDVNRNASDTARSSSDIIVGTNSSALYAAVEPSKNNVPIGATSNWSSNGNATFSNQSAATNKAAGPSLNNNAPNYTLSNSNATASVTKEAEVSAIDDKSFAFYEKAKDKNAIVKLGDKMNTSAAVITLPTIRIKRDSSIESIPVTGYFSKKEIAKPISFKLSKEDSLTVPINGWPAYNEYLRQNNAYTTIVYDTAYSPVTITNNRTGEEIVGLEFDIDKDGRPSKIKVTQSVDELTDAKAIELLKNGPKWQAASKKSKGKVAIKF